MLVVIMVPIFSVLTSSFVRVDIYSRIDSGKPSMFDPSKVDMKNIAKGGSGIILLLDISIFFLVLFYLIYIFWLLKKGGAEKVPYYTSQICFFVSEFREGVYYWCFFELIGRCIIAVCSELPIGVYPRLSLTLCILIGMILSQNKIQPFKLKNLNNFQATSMICQVFIVILVFIWYSIESAGASILLLLLEINYILTVSFKGFYIIKFN